MAMSLNRVQLIGNLTRDPEMRQIPGGHVVASFGVATNFTWKDQEGQQQSKTEFHNIVAWRRLAEICGEYLRKGAKVFVEGRLQTKTWEAEDGSKKYRTEIVADNMIMLGGRGEGGGAPMEREAGGVKVEKGEAEGEGVSAGAGAGGEEEVSIDDLPF